MKRRKKNIKIICDSEYKNESFDFKRKLAPKRKHGNCTAGNGKGFPAGNIDVELINVGNKAIPLDAMAAEKKANASLMTR